MFEHLLDEIDLPRWIREVQPVLISAPVGRSGTTLVQRLLNSTRQIVVFGENRHFFDFLPRMLFAVVGTHVRDHERFTYLRKRFERAPLETWDVNQLWPDSHRYTQNTLAYFESLVQVYQSTADSMGFSRWGIKQPIDRLEVFQQLRALFPASRCIFVYRNLFDVVRSARARQMTDEGYDAMVEFGRGWQANMTPMLDDPREGTLLVKYEDLIAAPEESCDALERFTNLRGIDRRVFDLKINTFRGPVEHGLSPQEYIEPHPLTEREMEGLVHGAQRALERTGYIEPSRVATG